MTRPEILDTAKKCVCGDREQDYGTPEKNFGTIAELWTAYKGIELTAVDVAAMLSLVKLGRIASGHAKADNWIDLAGYAACGGEIESAIVTELEKLPNRPTQAELEDLFIEPSAWDSEECVCGLTSVAKGGPAKGYEGLSNSILKECVCARFIDCGDGCPLYVKYQTYKCENIWIANHPEELRKIAIDWLEEQDNKMEEKV